MKTIRAFLAKASYTNNVVGQISEFFELSPFALTFSKRKGEYQYINFPGDILHTFVTKDGDADYTLGVTELDEVSSVVASAVDYMTSHLFPFDLTDLFNTVQADMAGRISQLQFGAIKVGLEHTLPEWIEWRSVTHVDLVVRVWLSNEAFENQYTEYEIVTVPPIDNLDRFFGHYGALASELGALTITDTIGRIQDFKGGVPESYTRVYTFSYINPQNTAQSTPVNWGVLVYGKNGDNIDAIKDAIVSYVLQNSTNTLDEWKSIFPDLFKRTEFLLYPRWDKVAIANLTDLAAIYSSISEPAETYEFALAKWPSVTADWVRANLSVFPFDYKAIQVVVLNGTTNVVGKTHIKTLFPDYIPVPTSSVDFNRMSIATREWILQMVELIQIAETATEYSSIQNPIRRVYRDGLLYVTRIINEVNYLVAVRANT